MYLVGVVTVNRSVTGCDIIKPHSYLFGFYLNFHVLALDIEFTHELEALVKYGKQHEKLIQIEIKFHFLDKTA
ncbi:MAG: hypothetical protein EZS28_042287 [Streblomastix strix]|uniref:Uncharacterized protein n=1 Tax=Streblomastix strix TaxID=222440 RepID=A0A5J4TUL2_9EUKA|nr:MAG: hypothetical protein EZS28_042287 [Streblomastix strix]